MELEWKYIDELYREKYFDKDVPQVYLKSEADKVIAELKEENEKLKATPEQIMKEVFDKCLIYPKEMVRLDDAYKLAVSLRNQKYKRCLAMAKECEATALWCYQAANTLPTGFKATLFGKPVMIEPDRLYNRFGRLMKWNNRWLKIAEQFKEAK